MKIIMDAAIIDPEHGESGREPMELEPIGSQAWVRLKIGDQTWDIAYREFWDAARAVCIDNFDR